MFGLFKRQTREDPGFGLLVKKWGSWRGRVTTPLFPGHETELMIEAKDEAELDCCRKHFQQVASNSEVIRGQIARDALSTYRFYKEQEPEEDYAEFSWPQDMWSIMTPERWHIVSVTNEIESYVIILESFIIIDFDWPNPHQLLACLTDTGLSDLDITG